MNIIYGKWPATVASYDAASRECRVSIPGITDGSDVLPLAVFCNPLGDRAGDTEIRILPGDMVWVSFEQGDPRFPIIDGYRTPRSGNPTGWRRWEHANIQLTAENQFVITVGGTTITVTDGQVQINGADMHLSGNLFVLQSIFAAQAVSAGTDIFAVGNVGDQGGLKKMSDMRTKFNTHAGHYSPTNSVPSSPNQM